MNSETKMLECFPALQLFMPLAIINVGSECIMRVQIVGMRNWDNNSIYALQHCLCQARGNNEIYKWQQAWKWRTMDEVDLACLTCSFSFFCVYIYIYGQVWDKCTKIIYYLYIYIYFKLPFWIYIYNPKKKIVW